MVIVVLQGRDEVGGLAVIFDLPGIYQKRLGAGVKCKILDSAASGCYADRRPSETMTGNGRNQFIFTDGQVYSKTAVSRG